jgi:hypothetical protein
VQELHPLIVLLVEDKHMTYRSLLAIAMILAASFAISAQRARAIPNPSIDMKAFLRMANEAARHRETRRLSEEEFIRMSGESGVVILDARSREMYDRLHISGAVNLSFPDITVASLERLFPDKQQRILIYCNNNFVNAQRAFPTKVAPASLNLSTYISLYTYGYRNVYELGPLLDAKTTKLELISTDETAVADLR